MSSGREQIRVSREWLNLLKALPERGRLLVVGPSDSGKSTLCRWLSSKLRERVRLALVDADVGQSQVGPPACVGWRFAGETTLEYAFVGDVTPAPLPATALAETIHMVRRAESAGAELTLTDTTGYLSGPGGLALKNGKLEALAPLHLIALGDSPEIRRLLLCWRDDERLTVHRLPLSNSISQKTRAQRCRWRAELFAEELKDAHLQRLSLRGLAMTGLPTAGELARRGLSWRNLKGLLLCFHDRQRLGRGLGLLEAVDLRTREIVVRSRNLPEGISGVLFGTIRLDPQGQQLPGDVFSDFAAEEVDDGEADGCRP